MNAKFHKNQIQKSYGLFPKYERMLLELELENSNMLILHMNSNS